MYQGRDAGRGLETALRAAAAAHGIELSVIAARQRPWASVTFAGARHLLTLHLAGDADAIRHWLDALPESEVALAHHLVVDIAVTEFRDDQAALEALTVAED